MLDPLGFGVPPDELEFLGKCFIAEFRDASFDRKGRVVKKRQKPMVASTVRDTVGYLASTFRANKRGSPFHIQGGAHRGDTLAPYVKELLQAFEGQDPPPNRQRALTPEMLKDLQTLAKGMGGTTTHTGDLVEGAFFFAMRGCEFVQVRKRGKTRPLTLGNISFRDERGMELAQTDQYLETKARFVTITFVDQKNGKKMDRRSQMSTDLPLCPVRAWARICRRVRLTIPTADDKTLAFSIGSCLLYTSDAADE